jgi:hypothetical protein
LGRPRDFIFQLRAFEEFTCGSASAVSFSSVGMQRFFSAFYFGRKQRSRWSRAGNRDPRERRKRRAHRTGN